MISRKEELAIKEQRLFQLMAETGLNGILIKKQPNFSWLTGGGLNLVGIATEMGVASLLITRKGRYVIASRIEGRRIMDEEGLANLGFELLQHEWYSDQEVDLIRSTSGALSLIGTDAGLSECRNVESDIRRLRYALTANEVERYLYLGQKLSQAVEKVMLGIRPGDRECEIAGRVGQELWKDRIDPTGFIIAADERAFTYRHPIPTQQMIKRYVMVSVNARYQGLITTITRLLHFGPPSPAFSKQFADNLTVDCRMIAATRPGVALSVPFKAGVDAYRELGYRDEWQLHHQGGAMGYYARDIKATEATTEVVTENQACCWNPSITGTKTEDGFIVTAAGPRFITAPVIYPKVELTVDGQKMIRPGLLVLD